MSGGELPQITSDAAIVGPGANDLTISGNDASNVFVVDHGIVAAISGLTISDGLGSGVGEFNPDAGSAIDNMGTLQVANVALTDNTSDDEGAIYNVGVLTVLDSLISGNSSTYTGGGITSSYGGTVILENTIITANSAQTGGGFYEDRGATTTIIDSTIVGNTAQSGGGLYAGAMLMLQNTIVSGNTAASNPDIYGAFTDSGHNLLGTSLQGAAFGAGDVFSDTPDLTPLQDNGGPTFTTAPLPGSPAIGAGDNSGGPATDQRGAPPPSFGGDIGAVQSSYFIVNTTADSDDGSATGSTVSLRDAIAYGANQSSAVVKSCSIRASLGRARRRSP